jgi:tRNA(Ile)-lysidine synthase
MINKIREYIKNNHLLSDQVKIVYAAVSGGVDSCVMLDILFKIRVQYGFKIVILHYNHGVRGKESLLDEQFVESLAKKYDLGIVIGRLSGKFAKLSETYLREERLKFFDKTVANKKDCLIATGHNLDDNIETFIMRLSKGSRLQGLLGIRPARGCYIRPLLSVARKDILVYARKNNLEYREDITNQDIKILRNNIRHKIVPYLEKSLKSDFHQIIPKVIEDLYRYYSIYQEKLQESILISTKNTKTGISLHRKRYLIYSETMRRGLVEYCISNVYPLNYKVSDRNLAIWDDFVANAQVGKKKIFLEDGVALAERQYIMFSKHSSSKKVNQKLNLGTSVRISKTHQIKFQKVKKENISFTNDKNIEYIDGSKSGPSLKIKYWKDGDAFQPLGMTNKRKLSDFFTDLKINTMLKRDIPLVCKDDNIIWVAGYRLDNRFKVSADTKTVYKLELIKIEKK